VDAIAIEIGSVFIFQASLRARLPLICPKSNQGPHLMAQSWIVAGASP
jgi:hypothetical protein